MYDTFINSFPPENASVEEVDEWLRRWAFDHEQYEQYTFTTFFLCEIEPNLNGIDLRKLTANGLRMYLTKLCHFDVQVSALLSADIEKAKKVEKERIEKVCLFYPCSSCFHPDADRRAGEDG